MTMTGRDLDLHLRVSSTSKFKAGLSLLWVERYKLLILMGGTTRDKCKNLPTHRTCAALGLI